MINHFVAKGYAGAEYFCDRIQETAAIKSLLLNENNIALISPRRIGKTDLIWHVFDDVEIRRNYHCFVVDIYATKNLAEFVNMLGKAMVDEAIDFLIRMSSDTYESLFYQMPEKQRLLFLAIAKEGKAKEINGGQFLKRHKLSSASSVSSALKGLLEKDFVTVDKGVYSVYDQFFPLWLKSKGLI